MKLNNMIRGNLKKIIGIALILTLAIGGTVIYLISEEKAEMVAANINSEESDLITEEEPIEENIEEPVEEQKPVKVEEKTQAQEENTAKVDNDKETQKVNEQPKKQESQKQKEQSKPAVQPKKQANKGTTYTSKGLGISFDLPGSWNDKYVIKDTGNELKVFMKHSRNDEGLGLLFIITSDLEMGQFMDTIYGINKEQTLNGKKLVVGSPTDYKMIPNDSLEKQYREMLSQSKDVLRTLR